MKTSPGRRSASRLAVVVVAAGLGAGPHGSAGEPMDGNWPSFRGRRAGGVAEGHATPTTWSVEDSEGILWKTPVPGLGHSSPVVWGDRLFVTTAVGAEPDPYLKVGMYGNIAAVENEAEAVQRFRVWCLDKHTGKVLWIRTAYEGVPKVKRHTKSSHANPTPAVDGKRVVVSFGSEGLYAYDLDGKLLWKNDLGVLDSGFFMVPGAQWGYGSSPILHDGRVIVLADVQKDSFLAAFDAKSGKEMWRTPRNDVPTWGTPTIVKVDGRTQVAVNGWKHIGAYDFATGKEIWKLAAGGGDIPVPTPIAAHGLIFITNAHGGGAPIYAIRTSAKGEVALGERGAGEHVAWSVSRDGAYMPTPLVYGDFLYVLRDNGVLSVYDARTGDLKYSKRVGSGSAGFTASLVAGDGKLYASSETGDVYVLRPGPEYELLATNPMDEILMATPAISEGRLFFRTKSHVVAVEVSKKKAPAVKALREE